MTGRVRASTPRTRSGCANCRQRRIKCGEERPGCHRCLRSGWNCPGYDSNTPPGQGSTVPGSKSVALIDRISNNDTPPPTNITHYSLPFKVPGSQDERKALHYFSNFAALDLCGYLPSDFWSYRVPQRCQHNVPVRHAAAALGRIHMEYITADDPAGFTASHETTEKYRRAIKTLRRYLNGNVKADRTVVLMCSAIFYSFELIRSEREAALKHLRSGLEIVNSWQAEMGGQMGDGTSDLAQLVDIFARMDLQATIFDDQRLPVLDLRSYGELGNETEIRAFASLSEAQQSLFPVLHGAFDVLIRHTHYKFAELDAIPHEVFRQRREVLNRFDFWEKRLSLLEIAQQTEQEQPALTRQNRPSPAKDVQHKALAISKLHFHTIKLLLLHSLQDSIGQSAPTFDDAAPEMLGLAHRAMYPEAPDQRNTFSLHLGIVAPLFLLALKVSKTEIRDAAVDLLRAAKGRREGFYDADLMAGMVCGLDLRVRSENGVEEDGARRERGSRTGFGMGC